MVGVSSGDDGGNFHNLPHLLHQWRCSQTVACASTRDTSTCTWAVVSVPPPFLARVPLPNAVASSSLRSSSHAVSKELARAHFLCVELGQVQPQVAKRRSCRTMCFVFCVRDLRSLHVASVLPRDFSFNTSLFVTVSEDPFVWPLSASGPFIL